jgi:hypothetical protein
MDKIDSVLRAEKRRSELTDHLARQAKLFSTENFMKQLKVIVDEFLRSKSKKKGSNCSP